MSSATVAIFINPSPTLRHYRKFNKFLSKTRLSTPSFYPLKEPAVVYKKTVRLKKMMTAVSTENRFVGGCDDKRISPTISAFEQEALINNGGVSFHQRAGGIHTLINRLSKWVVAVTFAGFIILRCDAFALWAATGSVLNFMLSIMLKQILKQERPVSEVSSGPGMPSSHAQSIFFSLVFVILSVVEWMGLNGDTTILIILVVALGSYFSWLRVLLRYHTTSQVIAGTTVGSIFAVLWFWAWEAIVHHAYNSNAWVQLLLIVGVACYYLGFISYVLWHLIKD